MRRRPIKDLVLFFPPSLSPAAAAIGGPRCRLRAHGAGIGHPATAGVAVAVLLAAPGALTLFLGPFRLLGVMPTSRFLLSTPADVLGDWAMVHFATWSAKLFWYLYTLRHPPHDNASTPPTVALGVLAVVVHGYVTA